MSFKEIPHVCDCKQMLLTMASLSRGVFVQVPLDKEHDMYEKQFTAFLHAVRTGDLSDVRCHFQDAARTYAASWWITEAAGSPLPDGSVPE